MGKKKAAPGKVAAAKRAAPKKKPTERKHYTIIFHRASLPGISPGIVLKWNGNIVDLLKAIPPHIWSNGNVVEGRCADFIGACYSLPSIDASKMEMEVYNIYPPSTLLEDDDEFAWYKKMMTKIDTGEDGPVLVNLDPPFDVMQSGVELWRCPVSIYNPFLWGC